MLLKQLLSKNNFLLIIHLNLISKIFPIKIVQLVKKEKKIQTIFKCSSAFIEISFIKKAKKKNRNGNNKQQIIERSGNQIRLN